jgi:hypothetical protein
MRLLGDEGTHQCGPDRPSALSANAHCGEGRIALGRLLHLLPSLRMRDTQYVGQLLRVRYRTDDATPDEAT